MSHVEKRKFPATVEMLSDILTWIHDHIGHSKLNQKQKMQFELALEEAIVNIVMHGYSQQGGELTIEMTQTADALTFVLIDRGVAFDPISAPVQPHIPSQDMKEGGLGVKFLRISCDALKYARQDGCNILTLTKKFTSSSQ
jgi:anti-sigma regulatory factor (Ser/Thr protein kinase)